MDAIVIGLGIWLAAAVFAALIFSLAKQERRREKRLLDQDDLNLSPAHRQARFELELKLARATAEGALAARNKAEERLREAG